jgi:hypothetical protein
LHLAYARLVDMPVDPIGDARAGGPPATSEDAERLGLH